MQTYKRKNSAANNALAGLERGLGTGIALGQRSRALQQDEDNAAFARQQALRRAQVADQELQREEQQRAATSEAVGEYTREPERLQGGGGALTGPGVLAAQATVAQDATTERVSKIARKMADSGVPLSQIDTFITAVEQKHKKADDDAKRKQLVDQIGNLTKDGTLFGTKPDGTREENPETEKALDTLVEAAANPNVPVAALRADLMRLKRAQSNDRTRIAHRQSMISALDTDMANATAQFQNQPGPITPTQAEAQSKQLMRLQTLRDQFEVFYDEIHGTKGGVLSFSQQWNNAKNGIAFTHPRTGKPVSFAEEDSVREAEQIIMQQEKELNAFKIEKAKAEAERERANIANDAERAAATTMNAETNRSKLTLPKTPRPTTPDLSYKDAAAIVDDRIKNTASREEQQALLAKRDEMIASEIEKARTIMGSAKMDKEVLGNRKGATPKSREDQYFADPNASLFKDWTNEQIEAWIKTGEMPK